MFTTRIITDGGKEITEVYEGNNLFTLLGGNQVKSINEMNKSINELIDSL